MAILTRREALVTLGAAAVFSRRGTALTSAATGGALAERGGKSLRGAFMILNTPFTRDGAVDWDDLTAEAQFVDRCAAQGIVWPQGSSGVTTLTRDERLQGMDVLAKAVRGRRVALVLGVQGKDTAEMLAYARRADDLGTDAMIAMPPTTGTSMADYRAYFRALAQATAKPVILQTSGGARDLVPSTDLIIELAREFPHLGYVKEESEPLSARIQAETAARPPMQAIFSANFGVNWLYAMRLGIDGVITGNAMYADLFARIWDLRERGKTDELRTAFATFLLMRNINEQVPGADLYILKKRGIFKTMITRKGLPQPGESVKLNERTFSAMEIEEIEFRFAALKPYLTT